MSWFRRILPFTLLAVAGAGAAYVQSEGFSLKWRSFVVEQFEQRGVFLTLDKLTLDPLEGLVARNIRIFLDKEHEMLLADVDRLNLDLDYASMARSEQFLEGVDLRNADLTFPIDPEDPRSEKVKLDNLNARLYLAGDRLEIRKAGGTLFGLDIQVRGSLVRPPPDRRPVSEDEARERRRHLMAALHQRRELIVNAARILRHFESAEAPRLDIEVNGDLGRPEALNATLRFTARKLQHGTYVCEEMEALATYAGEQVDLSRFWLKDHLGELDAGASWQLGGKDVAFHLRSSADLPGLASALADREELRELVFYEPLNLNAEGRILLGKAVPEGAFLPVECVGTLSAGRFTSRGEVLEGLEASFGLSTKGCYFRDVMLRHETGTLGLQAMWHKGQSFRYKALLQLDPHIFLPFMDRLKQTQEIIGRFGFSEKSGIYVELEGEGTEPGPAACQNHGRVELHHFSYRGTEFERASGDVEFTGNTHTYRNVELRRKEGRASAREVHCDDDVHSVRLTSVFSDMDPVALTGCFAPETAEAIARYRFDRHPKTELDGIIHRDAGADLRVKFQSDGTGHYPLWGEDYAIHKPVGDLTFAGGALTYDIRGTLFGESMACKGTADLKAESGNYTVDFRAGRFPYVIFGKSLPFENVRVTVASKAGVAGFGVQSSLLGGRFGLDGRVDDTRQAQRYSGEMRLDAISFNKFARIYSPKDATEGDVTGHLKFSGVLGDWRSLKGQGALVILNSNLYAVPILGPLTPLIGAVLPRPIKGYNVAKEADCTFKVADGFVESEDIVALTTVFRLVSKGKVDFLEDRIQFEAKAKFRGLPGLVLFPVSEILEYVGEGSVGNPLWRPRYFSATKEKTEFRKEGEKPGEDPAGPAPAKDSRFKQPGNPLRK